MRVNTSFVGRVVGFCVGRVFGVSTLGVVVGVDVDTTGIVVVEVVVAITSGNVVPF